MIDLKTLRYALFTQRTSFLNHQSPFRSTDKTSPKPAGSTLKASSQLVLKSLFAKQCTENRFIKSADDSSDLEHLIEDLSQLFLSSLNHHQSPSLLAFNNHFFIFIVYVFFCLFIYFFISFFRCFISFETKSCVFKLFHH